MGYRVSVSASPLTIAIPILSKGSLSMIKKYRSKASPQESKHCCGFAKIKSNKNNSSKSKISWILRFCVFLQKTAVNFKFAEAIGFLGCNLPSLYSFHMTTCLCYKAEHNWYVGNSFVHDGRAREIILMTVSCRTCRSRSMTTYQVAIDSQRKADGKL